MTDSSDASLWARARRWLSAVRRSTPEAAPPEPEALAPPADLLPADTLTGLPNRDALMELLQEAIVDSETRNEPLALLVLDVDRFKHVNQVLGVAFGDRILVRLAQRLEESLEPGHRLARIGGDRFALLMPATGAQEAENRWQTIQTRFERPLTWDDQSLDIRLSMGLALCPHHAGDADTLLTRAESALRAAKLQGGGCQSYNLSHDANSAANLALLADLRQAIGLGQLRLFLQPKITLGNGVVSGAEALVRWQHPQRGLVQPTQFIPVVEQTRLIRHLTLWVFEQAAIEQVALAVLGVRRVSINLSARDLMDQALPEKLEQILRRHRAVADGFCLEVTERALMSDPLRIEASLKRLAERGFMLSIDDFGTGYSCLSTLERLPVAELKIDKRFVMAMPDDPGAGRVVRTAIDIAHQLNMSVVAEGVENQALLAHLQHLGCDEGQGFHMSPPMPVAQFQDWLACWQAAPPASAGAAATHGLAMLH